MEEPVVNYLRMKEHEREVHVDFSASFRAARREDQKIIKKDGFGSTARAQSGLRDPTFFFFCVSSPSHSHSTRQTTR